MSFIGASVKVPSNNIIPNEEHYTVDNAVCDKKNQSTEGTEGTKTRFYY